ncbi:hypothetical protein DF3PB_1410010 [uncultured Defluviicoccus sp.]|uniref:Uncharacterized protein n=1 Tax=metagenome TaxID=256318 RepID=A0A380TAC3_9ZZZZ|nr:hypothetical protein DF3PB_1410010 [uncultured Defluviicoccus sp.]
MESVTIKKNTREGTREYCGLTGQADRCRHDTAREGRAPVPASGGGRAAELPVQHRS